MIKRVVYDYIRSFRWKNIRQLDKERNKATGRGKVSDENNHSTTGNTCNL